MENPEKEIEETVLKLTRGSPRVQQQTLESYFTPNASFQHPVCAVNGSRHNILMVYRWYKIMSPTIELKVDGVAYDKSRQRMYVDIQQVFRIWPLIPLGYKADVRLTAVLQLTRDSTGQDQTAERAPPDNEDETSISPKTYVPTGTSPFTSDGTEKPASLIPKIREPPVKYYIKSQNDLYQTDQVASFMSLFGLLPLAVRIFQQLATVVCVLAAIVFAPVTNQLQTWTDKPVDHRTRVRSSPAVGPSIPLAKDNAERLRDAWELEARYLTNMTTGNDLGKMKMRMKMDETQNGARPTLDWMKMERSDAPTKKENVVTKKAKK